MTYYKVKPAYDNYFLRKLDKRTRKERYIGALVGNELYTEAELKRMRESGIRGLCPDYFEIVEVSKRKIYWFFGARFTAHK